MTTSLTRRSFLRGVITTTAVIATTTPTLLTPTIWGDLIHDDAAGLNALLQGHPVQILSDALSITDADNITISGGEFLVKSTIRSVRDAIIHNCYFTAHNADFQGKPLLQHESGNLLLHSCHFDAVSATTLHSML